MIDPRFKFDTWSGPNLDSWSETRLSIRDLIFELDPNWPWHQYSTSITDSGLDPDTQLETRSWFEIWIGTRHPNWESIFESRFDLNTRLETRPWPGFRLETWLRHFIWNPTPILNSRLRPNFQIGTRSRYSIWDPTFKLGFDSKICPWRWIHDPTSIPNLESDPDSWFRIWLSNQDPTLTSDQELDSNIQS